MARATIIARLARSRYRIELDFGSAYKAAELARLNDQINALDADIAAIAVQVAAADTAETAQRVAVVIAFDAYAAEIAAGNHPTLDAYENALNTLRDLQIAHQELRTRADMLTVSRANLLRGVAQLNEFAPIVQRDAWLPLYEEINDLYDGLYHPGDVVDAWPINGEPDHYVLSTASYYVSPTTQLVARQTMTDAQVFANAARLPGWQKWKPTHRWGTVTAVYYDTFRLDVTLAPATSSAQQLQINQTDTLSGVRVDIEGGALWGNYSSNIIRAFMPGDRVVVAFDNMDWTQPRVIGFLDNPWRGGTHISWGTSFLFRYSASWSWYPGLNPSTFLGSTWIDRNTPSFTLIAHPPYEEMGFFRVGFSSGDKSVTIHYTDTYPEPRDAYLSTSYFIYSYYDNDRKYWSIAPPIYAYRSDYQIDWDALEYTYPDTARVTLTNVIEDHVYYFTQEAQDNDWVYPFQLEGAITLPTGHAVKLKWDVWGKQIEQSSYEWFAD